MPLFRRKSEQITAKHLTLDHRLVMPKGVASITELRRWSHSQADDRVEVRVEWGGRKQTHTFDWNEKVEVHT